MGNSRIREAGFRVLLVPAARVVHLSGASSKRKEPARTRIEFHRSLYRFLAVHRGRGVARIAAAVRFVKGVLSLLLGLLLAPLSARQRRRNAARWQLLRWHARGCPAGWGLAPAGWGAGEQGPGLDASPRTREAQRSDLQRGGVE